MALLVCGPPSRSPRRALHRLSLTQRTSQWPLQAVDGQLAARLACRTGVWRGRRKWIRTARLRRQVVRPRVDAQDGASAEHDGDRNRGNSSAGRFLAGGAAQQGRGKQDGSVAERWSSLPGWRQIWWRCCAKAIVRTLPCGAARADCKARCSCSLNSCWTSVGSRGGAECPCSEWLALALGYQGILFPMFCVGRSYGSALPGSAGTIPNPYTTVHPHRARARSKRRAGARGERGNVTYRV